MPHGLILKAILEAVVSLPLSKPRNNCIIKHYLHRPDTFRRFLPTEHATLRASMCSTIWPFGSVSIKLHIVPHNCQINVLVLRALRFTVRPAVCSSHTYTFTSGICSRLARQKGKCPPFGLCDHFWDCCSKGKSKLRTNGGQGLIKPIFFGF